MRLILVNKICIVIFGLLTGLFMAGSAAQGGQTYISNAGFEVNTWGLGFADEWWSWPEGTAAYHNPDPNKAHSGNAYITISSDSNEWPNVGPTYRIPVSRDTNYIIGGYIADANGGQSGQNLYGTSAIRIDWYANEDDPYELLLGSDSVTPAVPKDGNYYYYSGVFRNNYDANFAQVIIAATKISGQTPIFKFDDIVFAKANPPAKPDYNGDKTVNFTDFAYLAAGYGKDDVNCDMDGNGTFGFSDLAIFTHEWLRTIPDIAGYHFVWSDEFDGTEIDRTNWTYSVGDSMTNGELASYTDRPDNSVVENGCLVIIAKQEQYGSRDYTSAKVRSQTKADFLYGRIAARIKLPVGQGIWPAFWMMPTTSVYGGWPHSGEIDILETINACDRVYGTMHFTDANGQHDSSGGTYYAGGLCFANDYHVFAIEWDPDEIRWYLDDIEYFSETNWTSDTNPYPAPFNQQFYLILNIAVGGNWPGPPDQTTVFPQRMYIDWVRVYQKNP